MLEAHRSLSATLGDAGGWIAALGYGDVLAEHRAVRERVGLIDRSGGGAIRVGGSEAIQFLNGLVSNDVKSLAVHHGISAAFLTGHGKVRAICRILGCGDSFLILTEPRTHDKIFNYVFPFSYAGDFPVEDVSTEFRILSLQGPGAPAVLREICFEPVPQLVEGQWIETIVGGHHVSVLRASHTGELGFDILVAESGLRDLWDFVLLKGDYHGLVPVGAEALNLLRIEAGIPVYGVDIDEGNMMLETGLSDAVSFTKGCYTGQEAVAMATYRGHVSRRLSGLMIEGDVVPSAGSRLAKDGKEIGQVTSAIRSATMNAVIALAVVKYGYFESGTELKVLDEQGILDARIAKLPFYSHLAKQN